MLWNKKKTWKALPEDIQKRLDLLTPTAYSDILQAIVTIHDKISRIEQQAKLNNLVPFDVVQSKAKTLPKKKGKPSFSNIL
jgi:hypothetical protein